MTIPVAGMIYRGWAYESISSKSAWRFKIETEIMAISMLIEMQLNKKNVSYSSQLVSFQDCTDLQIAEIWVI